MRRPSEPFLTAVLGLLVLSGCFGTDHQETPAPPATPAPSSAVAVHWGTPVDLKSIGYEPSIAVDSTGALFVTAHKDLTRPDTWPYPASVILVSTDHGATWHSPDAPANVYQAFAGDEGDLAVDGRDWLFYTDTYLADNHLHVWSQQGKKWEYSLPVQRSTFADDRPWIMAQGEGVLHYLGNNGIGSPGIRYVYYRSADGGLTWTTGRGLPLAGWAHGVAHSNGTHAFIMQERDAADTTDITVSSSKDLGVSWSDPVVVGTRSGAAGDGFAHVGVDAGGNPAVVWVEGRASDQASKQKGNKLFFASSPDHGETWNATEVTPFEEAYMDHVTLSGGRGGTWGVAFYATEDLPMSATSKWHLYAGVTRGPVENASSFNFTKADPQVLYTGEDLHALHDFFEVAIDPQDALNIAYMTNLPPQAPNQVDGDRHLWFVRGTVDPDVAG